jgi:transcriptional regulator with XRE-family HTH domain
MMMKKETGVKNNLKEARFFAKKSQAQLWLETGIHYSTISRIECGYVEPADEQKKKLANALHVETDWLFPVPEVGKKSIKEDYLGKKRIKGKRKDG